MRARFSAEILVFETAAVAHLWLGWQFHAIDFRFFPSNSIWPYTIVGISALYAATGFSMIFKWRNITILLAKCVALAFIFGAFEFMSVGTGILQILPSVLVLCARSKVIDKALEDHS